MLKKNSIILIAIVLTIFFFSLMWWLVSTHKIMTFDHNSYVQIERKEMSPSYEVIWILVKPLAHLETVRNAVEETCKDLCDIHMYDTLEAYKLDKEYQALENRSESIRDAWKDKFEYLSEHKVGLTNFDVLSVIEHPYKTRP